MKNMSAAVLALLGYTSAKMTIDPSTRTLRDEHDRHTVLHGVNIVYKIDPYIPTEGAFDSQLSLDDQDIYNLKSWGFNMVRLGVMWEAVERKAGQYDEAYLAKIDELITRLGKAGIYTLVDAHQDVMAREICGEGMPDFYAKQITDAGSYCINKDTDWWLKPLFKLSGTCKSIKDYGFEYDKNGDPLIKDCQKHNFGMYYSSPESLSIFRALYMNSDGLADKFVNYWANTTQKLSSNPYVIGYDPLNEPSPSWTSIKDLFGTLKPGAFDHNNLAPLYTRVNEKIQNVDKEGILWFEPGQFPDGFGLGVPLIFNVGFQTPPGGKIGSPNHVLNDHTYCCQLSPGICAATGEPSLKDAGKCLNFHQKKLGARANDSKRLGVPLFISEFGACMDSVGCLKEIVQVADVNEEIGSSGWAYWEFKTYKDLTTSAGDRSEGFYNFDGSLQSRKVMALGRTYVQAAQGTIKHSKFATVDGNQLKAGQYVTDIEIDTSIDAPTVIHALMSNTPEPWYSEVPMVIVLDFEKGSTPDCGIDINIVYNKIEVDLTDAMDGKTLRVCVTPQDVAIDCQGYTPEKTFNY